MKLDQDMINQIAWMCGFKPEQFKRAEVMHGPVTQIVLSVYEEKNVIAEISLIYGSYNKRQKYDLTCINSTVMRQFKPFIQILHGLKEQGDIELYLNGLHNPRSRERSL